jgi:hypothetical protein
VSAAIVEKYDGLALVASKKFSSVRGCREIYLRGEDYPHPEVFAFLHPGDICVEEGDRVRVALDAWADVTTREDGSRSWAGSEWRLREGTKLEGGAK